MRNKTLWDKFGVVDLFVLVLFGFIFGIFLQTESSSGEANAPQYMLIQSIVNSAAYLLVWVIYSRKASNQFSRALALAIYGGGIISILNGTIFLTLRSNNILSEFSFTFQSIAPYILTVTVSTFIFCIVTSGLLLILVRAITIVGSALYESLLRKIGS